jgi:hypothetical protein
MCFSFSGSQYSDYMVLDYSCLQGPSLSVCDQRTIATTLDDQASINSNPNEHRLFVRSPNYPNEYENILNCSCHIDTQQATVKFLDFYLEERDEMNLCSRDRLQIADRSYCGSSLDDHKHLSSPLFLNSSSQLTFKSNDVITRKGFWLMISSVSSLRISCENLLETSTISTSTVSSTSVRSTTTNAAYFIFPSTSTDSMTLSTSSLRSNSQQKRRHALSYVLLLTIIFVIVLLMLNVILIVLCWKQRRTKQPMDSKSNSTNRPFFCSLRSSASSSSSVTYGDTPVLHSLDGPKQTSTSNSRYIFQPNTLRIDNTPSTSTTTATTGAYEDLQDSINMQRSLTQTKPCHEHLIYMQQQHQQQLPSVAINTPQSGYNRMIHFPPAPIRCHFSTPAQTFYPPQPFFDSQHIYETIQDGHCPYQRLAATLRRSHAVSAGCTCYHEHPDEKYASRTDRLEISRVDLNPETLV